MIKSTNLGFSLIELMIVVVIIAILAIIGVPAYNTYINKAHLSEIFSIIKQDQNNIVTYATTSNMPASTTDATTMLSNIGSLNVCSSKYVSTTAGDCTFNNYGIHVVTNSALLPYMVLDFMPVNNGKLVQWTCTYESTTVTDGLTILPLTCKQLNTSLTSLW